MKRKIPDIDYNFTQKTPDWKQRMMRLILTDALIFILAIGFVEVGLRLFVPSIKGLIFTRGVTGGHEILYNEMGLRDDEFPLQKPQGERRILALGNSTTFGSGVRHNDTYPQQLQQLYDGNVQVINGGGQGGSIDTILDFYKSKGADLSPDAVIFAFSPSMIGKSAGVDIKPKPFSGLLKSLHSTMFHSYAYASFDYYIRKNMYRFGIIKDDVGERSSGSAYAYAFDVQGVEIEKVRQDYADFFKKLEDLRALLDADNVPFYILSIPSQFEIDVSSGGNARNYPLEKIQIYPAQEIQEFADKNGITFIDMGEILKGHNSPLYIRSDNTHLNALGLKLVAEELFGAIEN